MEMQLTGMAALLIAVMLAGCAGPAGTISLEPVADETIADHASQSLGGIHERPADRIVPAAIENGSVIANGQSPQIGPGLPFAYDGAYYNLSYTLVNTSTGVSISVSTNYTVAGTDADTISYDALPVPDREALTDLFPPRDRPQERLRIGAQSVYTAAEQEHSVFIPFPEYTAVEYNGTSYRLRVGDRRQVDIHSYRYTADMVAPSAERYAQQLRDQYLFTLNGLTPAEREVIDAAVNDRYYAENSGDDGFQAVVDRFRDRPAVQRGASAGDWLVRYDGTIYWADLMFPQFTDAS
jgi:hypothetical protein